MVDKQRKNISEFAAPLAAVIAFPVLIIGAWLILGDELPLQALTVMAGAYAMFLVWAGLSIAARGEEARTQAVMETTPAREPVALPARVPGLELLYTVPMPPVPCTVAVMSAVGACPRGIRVGDRLEVDAEGRLSSPLCRTAVETLKPLILKASNGRDFQPQVSCVCPIAGRHLTFGIRPTSAASAN